jgi:2-polyprenyl-3-methyl-5-hydroxy-6-metoxy-1,4-benzoquinol methylase
MQKLTQEQIELVRKTPHFRDSHYASWDLQENLDFYTKGFVETLPDSIKNGGTVADIGCGYGWLAISFALNTKATIYAVEPNEPRLVCARSIAKILGVEDRIIWLVGSIGNIPIPDKSVDAVFCIEVIEHISTDPSVIRDLARISRDRLVVATPNGLLPIVLHDTCLPFCHWLPNPLRNRYASLFGRAHLQDGNKFWTGWGVSRSIPDFKLKSSLFRFFIPNLRLTFTKRAYPLGTPATN